MPNINSNQTALEKIRRAAGMTREDLAKKSDVSIRTIGNYEQRVSNINHAQCIIVLRLAEALGVSVQKILNKDDGDKI